MSTRNNARLSGLIPGALFILGSLLFLSGGRHHPNVNSSLGAMGSEAFYRAFAAAITHESTWESMHVLILAGPVLWALGAASLAPGLAGHMSIERLGRAALALGAVAWMVTFVFDGFVAPVIAGALISAPTDAASGALLAFRTNQTTVIKLGLLSWTLLGAGTLAFSIGMLRSTRLASARAVLGATGVLVGAWPMIAWAIGEFDPGPFTSGWWSETAIVTALWYASLGVLTIVDGARRAVAAAERSERATASASSAELSPA